MIEIEQLEDEKKELDTQFNDMVRSVEPGGHIYISMIQAESQHQANEQKINKLLKKTKKKLSDAKVKELATEVFDLREKQRNILGEMLRFSLKPAKEKLEESQKNYSQLLKQCEAQPDPKAKALALAAQQQIQKIKIRIMQNLMDQSTRIERQALTTEQPKYVTKTIFKKADIDRQIYSIKQEMGLSQPISAKRAPTGILLTPKELAKQQQETEKELAAAKKAAEEYAANPKTLSYAASKPYEPSKPPLLSRAKTPPKQEPTGFPAPPKAPPPGKPTYNTPERTVNAQPVFTGTPPGAKRPPGPPPGPPPGFVKRQSASINKPLPAPPTRTAASSIPIAPPLPDLSKMGVIKTGVAKSGVAPPKAPPRKQLPPGVKPPSGPPPGFRKQQSAPVIPIPSVASKLLGPPSTPPADMDRPFGLGPPPKDMLKRSDTEPKKIKKIEKIEKNSGISDLLASIRMGRQPKTTPGSGGKKR